jgi:hypothetical protein
MIKKGRPKKKTLPKEIENLV